MEREVLSLVIIGKLPECCSGAGFAKQIAAVSYGQTPVAVHVELYYIQHSELISVLRPSAFDARHARRPCL